MVFAEAVSLMVCFAGFCPTAKTLRRIFLPFVTGRENKISIVNFSIIMRSLLLAARPFSRPLLSHPALSTRLFSSSSQIHKDVASEAEVASATPVLTWNDFLQLRQTRRRLQMTSSVFTGFLGVTTGWGYLATIEIDPTQMIFGFDPVLVLGCSLLGCGALGALAGPFLGDFVFKYGTLRGRRHIFDEV